MKNFGIKMTMNIKNLSPNKMNLLGDSEPPYPLVEV